MSSDLAELERAADVMPDGWREVAVVDVVAMLPGFAFKSENFVTDTDAGLPLIRIRDLGQTNTATRYVGDYDEAFAVRDGDILVGMDGSFEAVRWRGGKALLNQRVLKLSSARPSAMDEGYLFYRVQPALVELEQTISGTTVKHLSTKDLRRLTWQLPPLDEQRRIAEVLRSVDEAIAAADMVARQWAVAFGTLLDVAFLEGEPASVSDICSLIYRYPGFYGFDQLDAGVPVIRGEHLRAGRISRDWEDFYFVDPAFSARFPKTILELDDVVMSVRGTVGTTAIVDAAHVGSQISPNLIRLVADPTKIMPPLLYYAVQSAVAHIRRTIVNAQALPAINAGDLKQVEIALPPLTDQPALLAELNGAATACADAVAATQQARQTKAVVMSDLLSGHVRVSA